jgi:3-oxoacyl-[acyl-carrier protein] reductase
MFVQAGARVVFNYQKAEGEAKQIVRECGQDKCVAVKCDLEGTKTAKGLVTATVEQFGRLDVLVANHGIWPPEERGVEEMTDEQWRRTVAVNLDSVFALAKYSVAQMQLTATTESPAHIVFVSSTAAQRGEAFHVDYAATKGALISMVKGLSTELAPHHIYVNCVAPGWVDTDMSKPALQDLDIAMGILANIPLGRVGTPEELAAPILFLCTPLAGFITGEVLNVNGGAVLVG